jgi:hypothetical protein
MRNVRFYIYPARREAHQELITSRTIEIPQPIRFLYEHLLDNRNITDVQTFNPDILHIYHKDVLRMIRNGEPGWEKNVPPDAAQLIREKRLFGWSPESRTDEAFASPDKISKSNQP